MNKSECQKVQKQALFDAQFFILPKPHKESFREILDCFKAKHRTNFGIPSIIMQFDFVEASSCIILEHTSSSIGNCAWVEILLISQGEVLSWWSLNILPKIVLTLNAYGWSLVSAPSEFNFDKKCIEQELPKLLIDIISLNANSKKI